jgi:UDP-N-acetyl-D-mannosaminuronic acid dehydrogenase
MNKFKYDICIFGGLGHVGLPLGIFLADKGFSVLLYDKNEKNLEIVSKGKMPFIEYGADKILKKNLNKKLYVTKNYNEVFLSENIIITIGTPIDEYLNPKLNQFVNIIKNLSLKLKKDHNIIIRSSVYPGTMEIINNILKKKKLKNISYCPERIVQGYAIKELANLPQIISAFNKSSEKKAINIFSKISKKIIITSIIEAEMVKLISNSWRYIQFASANQFFMICSQNNINFDRIRKIMTDSYSRGEGLPSAGFAAGPCLLKDTMQLYSFSKNIFSMGNASMLINEGMPTFVINQLKNKFNISKKKIGILGMSFKANIDDKRDSLSYKILNLIKHDCKKVYCSDEHIKDEKFISKNILIKKSDIIIIATPHNEYKNLKIPKNKFLVDIWSLYKK